jgi:hypothetical protein
MEQVLIGQNAGVIWHILDGKKSVELSHLKRNPNFQMQSSGLLSVGCLRKTNFPSLQKK